MQESMLHVQCVKWPFPLFLGRGPGGSLEGAVLTVGERKVRPRAHRARARRTPAFVPYKGLQSFGETAATAPLKTIPVAKVNLQGKLGGRLRML